MGELLVWFLILSTSLFASSSAIAQQSLPANSVSSEINGHPINQGSASTALRNSSSFLENYYVRDAQGKWVLKQIEPSNSGTSLFQLNSLNSSNVLQGLPSRTVPRTIENPFPINSRNPTTVITDPRTFPTTDPPLIVEPTLDTPTGPELPTEPIIPQQSPGCLTCQPTSPEVVGGALTELKAELLLRAPTASNLALINKIDSTNSTLDSEEARECSASVAHYNSAKSTCGTVCTEELIRDYTEDTSSAYYSLLQNLKRARNTLDETCMEGDISKLPFGFDQNYIFERTGVLILKARTDRHEDTLFCGASLLSQDTILTAKHCLIDRYGNQHLQTRRAIRDGLLLFVSLNHPDQPATVTALNTIEDGKERTLSNTHVPEDYIMLSIKNSVPLSTPTLSAKSSRLNEALILGWFKAANPNRYNGSGKSDWEKKIRWSKQKCVIFDVTDQCMIHTCSSENGFSGAPVWTLSPQPQRPQISGVQSAYSNATRECGFPADTKHTASFNIASSGFLGKTQ